MVPAHQRSDQLIEDSKGMIELTCIIEEGLGFCYLSLFEVQLCFEFGQELEQSSVAEGRNVMSRVFEGLEDAFVAL